MIRRTRIVCTIGPSSSSPATLRTMVQAGMDVARLNFSHGDHPTHRQAAEDVRAAAEAVGRPVAILGDLQGPKIRTGPLDTAFMRLARGRKVVLVGGPRRAADEIEVSHPELVDALRPGDRVLIDDGRIELVVRSTSNGRAECSVARGGLLGERKGVSVPGRPLPLPALTEKDIEDLKFAVELGVDYLALSFVRQPEDILACRKHLGAFGCKAPVIAKLEKLEAIRNLSQILEVADAVMVARGDLGVELKLGELPAVQKDVIDRANRAGKPVITATEMLESMVTSNRPTRAETSDVANAIWDGTDAVMLSQETSVGAHPVEAVRAMARICLSTQRHPAFARERQIWREPGEVGSAIAHAAAASANELHARVIIAFTESGTTALRCSKARPRVPVIAASPHEDVLRKTALYAGVIPL
ncbi:MAG TPA: pyruvate kinase, partial [Candidatus Dormibacteraeota bacterium]|nr:pyruvate kinase [Candidatus Dormibacteraeota bacterium]